MIQKIAAAADQLTKVKPFGQKLSYKMRALFQLGEKMNKLIGTLWIISGSALAGALVVAVLVTQMVPNLGLGIAAAAILGYVLAIPFSYYLSKKIK